MNTIKQKILVDSYWQQWDESIVNRGEAIIVQLSERRFAIAALTTRPGSENLAFGAKNFAQAKVLTPSADWSDTLAALALIQAGQ